MAPNNENRRSYGYIPEDKQPPRQFTAQPLAQKTSPKSEIKKKSPSQGKKLIFALLLLPFKIVWFFLRLFWGLFKKRPKLEKEASKALRKKIISWFILAGAGMTLLLVVYIAIISRNLPDPNRLTDRQVAQSTKIYDRTGGTILYEIFADQKRTLISFDEIPEKLIQAVVATEDTKFYEHNGLRPFSIARSIVNGLTGRGRLGSGASTLTQQLVKNAILTNERSISRKIKEAILSLQLERRYSKDQILQIYFNEIPYGSTNYGVQSASQSYFGKDVGELDLQEIATLAGLPKAPSKYLRDKEALKLRRNFVLRRMYEEGIISEKEKNEAQAKETTVQRSISNIKAPHFVLYVRDKLIEEYGEQLVDTGGLKVITSLDWEKQQIAEKVIEEIGTVKLDEAGANNTSLLAMDPKTGQILAMVGSKDFYNEEIDGQFNVATLGKRQPGSSFKPIVYTAAFEKGFTPDTVLFDVVTNFAASGKDYTPLNYDLAEHGPVTMRQALQGSLNIPAVKALYLVGDKKGVEFAERLGYTTLSDGDFGLSLVLGGGEVKLVDHVGAYSIFANGGKKIEQISILKVEDNKGDVLQEWKPKKQEQILDEKVTATISNVLSDDNARAYAFGAGGILTLPGRPVATKTGTTNGYVDAWTIGYTPSLVTGVWAGNTKNTPMKRGFGGSKVAAPIWNAFMKEALKNTPVESFPTPPANDATKPALRGSEGGGVSLLVDKVTGKLATSSTPERYIVERIYTQAHSILHYVNKDDPRGPAPENPDNDPQYQIWEAAIQDWIRRKKEENPDWEIVFEEPPSEFDDIHSLELIPSLEVIYPANSSTIFSRQIDTDIRVSAKRGVTRVAYKLDGKGVALVREHPFNLNYFAKGLTPGDHTLTVIVFDDVGNTLEEDVVFTFDPKNELSSVSWGTGNQTIAESDFPRTFELSASKINEINSIDIVLEKDGERIVLKTFSELSSQLEFVWEGVEEKGEYNLIAEIEESSGGKRETDRIRVMVQ